jgi:hypothetical protein
MDFIKFWWKQIRNPGWRHLVLLLVLVAYAAMLRYQSADIAEILGDLVIIAGALLIARGVVLSKERRAWHFSFRDEQKKSPTVYVDLDAVKLQQLWLVRQLISGKPYAQIEATLLNELSTAGYNVAVSPPEAPSVKRLRPLDISDALLEASEYGEAGTLLVVIGTVWLGVLTAYKVISGG